MMYTPFLTIRSAAWIAGGSVPAGRPVRPALSVSAYGNGTVRGSRDPGTAPSGATWDCDGRACQLARDSADDRAWYARAYEVAVRACRGLDVDPGDLVAELWIASRGQYVTARDASSLVKVRRENARLARTMHRKRVSARQRSWVRMMIDDRKAQRAAVVAERKRARAARNLARDLARRDRVQSGQGQRGKRKVAPLEAGERVALRCSDGTMLDVARVYGAFAPSMRDMVELYVKGATQAEIADALDVDQATVSRKLTKVVTTINAFRA